MPRHSGHGGGAHGFSPAFPHHGGYGSGYGYGHGYASEGGQPGAGGERCGSQASVASGGAMATVADGACPQPFAAVDARQAIGALAGALVIATLVFAMAEARGRRRWQELPARVSAVDDAAPYRTSRVVAATMARAPWRARVLSLACIVFSAVTLVAIVFALAEFHSMAATKLAAWCAPLALAVGACGVTLLTRSEHAAATSRTVAVSSLFGCIPALLLLLPRCFAGACTPRVALSASATVSLDQIAVALAGASVLLAAWLLAALPSLSHLIAPRRCDVDEAA